METPPRNAKSGERAEAPPLSSGRDGRREVRDPGPGMARQSRVDGRTNGRPSLEDGRRVHGNGRLPLGTHRVREALRRAQNQFDWPGCLPSRARRRRWRIEQRIKRGVDLVLALLLLLILSPVFVVCALLVRLSSPGPIIYRWYAVGRRGRVFVTYKFRTMVENAEELKAELLPYNEMRGPAFKIRRDPRVTTLGRWLRRFSLDELPQLWSVLRGDMSLVGPRPPLPEEFVDFEPQHYAKLAVTPGVTCYWQVSGRNEIADFDEWVALDRKYIHEWSLWLDFKILARTIPEAIRGRGAY